MPDPVELDARLDELFTLPAGEFVKAREVLVRDLKREQRSEEAAEVHALRRPTVAVWGVNQMAHARRDRVAELVEAGRELEALQQEGAGARDELRAATRTRRGLLDQLTEVAASYTERADTSRAPSRPRSTPRPSIPSCATTWPRVDSRPSCLPRCASSATSATQRRRRRTSPVDVPRPVRRGSRRHLRRATTSRSGGPRLALNRGTSPG